MDEEEVKKKFKEAAEFDPEEALRRSRHRLNKFRAIGAAEAHVQKELSIIRRLKRMIRIAEEGTTDGGP